MVAVHSIPSTRGPVARHAPPHDHPRHIAQFEKTSFNNMALSLSRNPASYSRDVLIETLFTERLDRVEEHLLIGTTGKDGAEEKDTDDDLQDQPCPLCDNPIDPATDQYLLKCMFAHEEILRRLQDA